MATCNALWQARASLQKKERAKGFQESGWCGCGWEKISHSKTASAKRGIKDAIGQKLPTYAVQLRLAGQHTA